MLAGRALDFTLGKLSPPLPYCLAFRAEKDGQGYPFPLGLLGLNHWLA